MRNRERRREDRRRIELNLSSFLGYIWLSLSSLCIIFSCLYLTALLLFLLIIFPCLYLTALLLFLFIISFKASSSPCLHITAPLLFLLYSILSYFWHFLLYSTLLFPLYIAPSYSTLLCSFVCPLDLDSVISVLSGWLLSLWFQSYIFCICVSLLVLIYHPLSVLPQSLFPLWPHFCLSGSVFWVLSLQFKISLPIVLYLFYACSV